QPEQWHAEQISEVSKLSLYLKQQPAIDNMTNDDDVVAAADDDADDDDNIFMSAQAVRQQSNNIKAGKGLSAAFK
ncbi:hypothetical protein FF38_11990, partial [Lucilia cuprina]